MKLIRVGTPDGDRFINPSAIVWIRDVASDHCTVQLAGGEAFDVVYAAEEFLKIIGAAVVRARDLP